MKGAIFDLDGTLLDSMHIWEEAPDRFLEEAGRVPEAGLGEIIKRMSLREACEYVRDRYRIPMTADEVAEKVVWFAADFYRNEALLKPGVREFLNELQARGIRMCIATAGDRKLAEAALERNGVLHYFLKVFTCNDTGYGKNDPHIFRIPADFCGTGKNETFVFEDSWHAARTAHDDGFPVIGIYDRHEKEQEKLKEYSDLYVKSFSEIIPAGII